MIPPGRRSSDRLSQYDSPIPALAIVTQQSPQKLSAQDASLFLTALRRHGEQALPTLSKENSNSPAHAPFFRADIEVFLGLGDRQAVAKKLINLESKVAAQVMLPYLVLDAVLSAIDPNCPAVLYPRAPDRPPMGTQRLNDVFRFEFVARFCQLTHLADGHPPLRLACARNTSRGRPRRIPNEQGILNR